MDRNQINIENTNLGTFERSLSLFAGVFLIARGMTTKSLVTSVIGGYLAYRGMSGVCAIRDAVGGHHAMNVNVRCAMTVNKPVDEVFAFWEKFENLPLFMSHLDSVKVHDSRRSTWTASFSDALPSITWEAEVVNYKKNRVIGWHSIQNAMIENAGKVEFKNESEYATRLDIVFSYRAPLGMAGEKVAKFFNPMLENLVSDDLSAVKGFIESGFSKNNYTDFRNELI